LKIIEEPPFPDRNSRKNTPSPATLCGRLNALKKEGHAIRSSIRLGYMLQPDSDLISAEGIRSALPKCLSDMDIHVLPETGSTNNDCKRLIAEGIKGYTLVVAEKQTSGKGRLGRSFYSPEGSIYMSLAFHTEAEITEAVKLTTAASVAVVRAIEKLTDQKPLIKWVNDVYLDGKKICGILTEGVTDLESGHIRHIVIGIGLNCGDCQFPEELREIAGSIDRRGVSRNRFIAAIARELIACIEGGSFMDYYRSHSFVLGREINFIKNGVATPATALAIDDSGALIVRTLDGEEHCLNTGEISVRMRD